MTRMINKRSAALIKVIPLGFEPKTHSLEGCCSIQLSYGTLFCARKGNKINEKPPISGQQSLEGITDGQVNGKVIELVDGQYTPAFISHQGGIIHLHAQIQA